TADGSWDLPIPATFVIDQADIVRARHVSADYTTRMDLTVRRSGDVGVRERTRWMSNADIHFYFDPVCPFAWMTSKWVRIVQAQRDYAVDWRFISLRMINATVDCDRHFPVGSEAGHTAGL